MNKDNVGAIYEVDLEYPRELHNLHKDLPLAPEHFQYKLSTTLNNKINYVVHYKNLEFYLKHGLVLKKVHRILAFTEAPYLKEYINHNTKLRQKGKNDFEKDFFKLMNNACFGKTMENVRKRASIEIITSDEQRQKIIKKHNFRSEIIFSENFSVARMAKSKINLDKPIYIGFAVLELSKLLMYEFHYEYMKPKYDKNIDLCYMDTDSFIYDIRTEDFYGDIKADLQEKFDTSDYKKDNPYNFPAVNKKVIGMMKDELSGTIMSEFVGLRSKVYAYLKEGDNETKAKKKLKGIKTNIVKDKITLQNYKDVLFGKVESLSKTQYTLRANKHRMFLEKQNKKALDPNDTKRKVLKNKVNTVPWGFNP